MRKKMHWLLLVFLIGISWTQAQEKTITGNITDQDNVPLPGVNILVKGTTTGTQSDFDGNYAIQAIEGDVLVFSYLGQRTAELAVTESNVLNLQMQEDAETLEEVIVVGYGNQVEKKIIQNVSLIKEEAIENLQVVSADQLLQGQSAGTQIVNSSGVLGSAAVIRVRGVNSINSGSQPLIVIDGVPITDTAGNTLNRGGNTGINPLSYVNPNDIASLTVLKDAGATSIYGSRGANGVILITTKKGRKNSAATVTLDINTQFSESTDIPDILTPDQFRQFRSDIATIQNGTPTTPESLGLGALGSGGTDWLGGVQRTGVSQNYNLGIRGGSEKTTYFFGLDFQDSQGFIIGNDQQRAGARINIETTVNSWLKAGVNLGVTNNRLNRIGIENNTNAPFTTAFLQSPVVRAFDDEGEFAQSGSFIPNIFAVVALDTDELKTFRTIGNAFTEITPFKGLTWRSEFGMDKLNTEETLRSVEFNTPGGSAQQISVNEERWLTNQTLNYTNTFSENHNLTVLLGLNYEETLRTRLNVSSTGFLTDGLRNVGAGATPSILNGDRFPSRLFGLFSRVSYDYKGKYLVEGSIRRDGSSRFGANNRFGYFWSAAAGWVLSEESFLENADFLDYLSIRASIGTVGNDRLGTFPSLGLFNIGGFGDYNGVSGNVPGQRPENPDVKWEESATLDIGFKSAFLGGRINFNAAYFKKTTTDLLLNQVLPPQTGFSSISRNIGEMENKGFEFELSTVNVRSENFEWRTNINLTTIENKINRLNEDAATDAQGRRIIDGGIQRAIEGESLNNFFLIRYVGINPQTGDAEWLDVDGNITNTPGSGDRVVTGSPLPDFSGGITNTFTYKDFDLSILANYSYGNDVVIDGLRFFDGADAIGGIVNIRTQNLNFWRQPGDNAFLPSPNSSTFNAFNQRSDQQQLDASYLRIKNVTLGYNMPQKTLDRLGGIFKGIRFYATATNLITFKKDELDGIDPEVTDDIDPRFQGESFFTAPQAKSYSFGARLTF